MQWNRSREEGRNKGRKRRNEEWKGRGGKGNDRSRVVVSVMNHFRRK